MNLQTSGRFMCEVAGCDRPALAKCLCNAHYIRNKKGLPLDKPIRMQKLGRVCKIEGCGGKHYGNDLCVKHYRKWSRYDIKKRLIAELGGKCKACGNVYHPAAFDFHHLDPTKKEYSITDKFARLPFNKLLQEVRKCVLLCANCHRIEHAGDVP